LPLLSPNQAPDRASGAARGGGLPAPPPEALAQSTALVDRLREEIRRSSGAISFRRYMELVLYAPGLGYYSGGAAKLGPAGDFVTAPEVSALFGRCMARQAMEALAAIGEGEVLELGGGSGALAEAALAEAGHRLRWNMLEPSAELRARQRDRLGESVRWLDALPCGFRGVIIANEVADALPVERFTIVDGEPRRLGVTSIAAGLAWTLMAQDPDFAATVRALEAGLGRQFAEGHTAEFCPMLPAWVQGLAQCLEAGLLLIIDYGLPRGELYSAERTDGTLICHYRHRAHGDVFLWPGLQDLSAWVDFTAVAESGTAAGLTLEGFTTQAAFLSANGLDEMLQSAGRDEAGVTLAQQAKRLLLPGEMGERFRIMGLSRHLDPALSGFGLLDLSNRL
jgi:SAM-dependent MidA family methyltransferase